MHNNNTIKLFKLQGKNIKIDKYLVDDTKNTLSIYISKKVSSCSCPACKHETKKIHDHRIQKIKHNPINGYNTYIYLKKTRLYCSHCGKKFYMDYNNIVNPRFRCSNELFNNIISNLQNTSMTISEVATLNNVSTGVVSRYLLYFAYFMQWNNITTLPKHIGIDEFKGNCDKSKYLFHVYDLDTGKTVTILKTRKYADLVTFFGSIKNRNEVEIVTMDLYDTFRNAVKAKLKNATIVADRFHYTRVVGKAMDELRLQIWRNTEKAEKKYFKDLKLTLLKDIENVKSEKLLKHEEKLNHAFELSGELKYGYQLYQSFLRIKDGDNYAEKLKRFNDWISGALGSTLKTFESCANTFT